MFWHVAVDFFIFGILMLTLIQICEAYKKGSGLRFAKQKPKEQKSNQEYCFTSLIGLAQLNIPSYDELHFNLYFAPSRIFAAFHHRYNPYHHHDDLHHHHHHHLYFTPSRIFAALLFFTAESAAILLCNIGNIGNISIYLYLDHIFK